MLGMAVLFALGYAVAYAAAQAGVFEWGLLNSLQPSTFQECEEVPLAVYPLPNGIFFGVPPYFLIALELGGVPTMTNIGTDPTKLLWKADHKQGASLLLTIVDSQNNNGGVSAPGYTMTKGTDTSCIASPPQNMPVVTANVTETLNTCDPWGLLISGGKKPYTLYLAAANASTIIIVKMGKNDNFYTYINRAAPDTILLASVLDSDNQWAVSSAPVRTTGSTNVDCGGAESISGISPISSTGSGTTSESSTFAINTPPSRTNDTGGASEKSKNIPLIAALGTVLGILLIVGPGTILWWRRRRPQRISAQGTWDMHYEITPWVSPPPSARDMREMDAANHTGKLLEGGHGRSPTYVPLVDRTPVSSVRLNDTTPTTQSGYLDHTGGSSTPSPSTTNTGSSEDRREVSPQLSAQTHAVVSPDEQEIIVQHRDATVVVRELPPPYADGPNRSLGIPGSGSNGSRQC